MKTALHKMKTNPLPFLHRLRGSLFNARFYSALGRTSLKDSGLYLVKLLLIVSLIQAGTYSIPMVKEAFRFGNWAAEELPLIIIENGKVVTEIEEPVAVYFEPSLSDEVVPGSQEAGAVEVIAVVIDLDEETYKADDFAMAGALLTREKVAYCLGDPESRGEVDLKEIRDLRLSDSFFRGWARRVAVLIPAMLFGWLAIFAIVTKVVQATLLGLLTGIGPGRALRMENRIIIVLHALTPAILADLAVSLVGFSSEIELVSGYSVQAWVIGYVLLVIYSTFWAVKKAAEGRITESKIDVEA